MTDCDPLWPDGRDQLDETEQAFLDLHDLRAQPASPLADHGRPCGGPAVPHHRTTEDVLETL